MGGMEENAKLTSAMQSPSLIRFHKFLGDVL